MDIPRWQWEEMVQRGTDYADLDQVRVYDERMAALRDVEAEARKIVDSLRLASDDVLVEVGTGTGIVARAAAARCKAVLAVDVSEPMLAYAAKRAYEEGLGNISFIHAGFLTWEPGSEDEAPTAAVSQLALHHLPDVWKLLALKRLAGFMAAGGRLYLSDVVYPDEAQADWPAYVEDFVSRMPAELREAMVRHVGHEFSTFDWIMHGILERAGFAIEDAEMEGGFRAHYVCRKVWQAAE